MLLVKPLLQQEQSSPKLPEPVFCSTNGCKGVFVACLRGNPKCFSDGQAVRPQKWIRFQLIPKQARNSWHILQKLNRNRAILNRTTNQSINQSNPQNPANHLPWHVLHQSRSSSFASLYSQGPHSQQTLRCFVCIHARSTPWYLETA